MSKVIIIDDDQALCRSLQIQLAEEGHEIDYANTGREGLSLVFESKPDLVLLDLGLPDGNGLEVLRKIKAHDPEIAVMIITGQQDMKATISAMQIGALDYIRKPFDRDDMLLAVEKAKRLSRSAKPVALMPINKDRVAKEKHEIIGADKKIIEVIKQIGLLSGSQVSVLIEGDSGTGKELVARALHEARAPDKPFVAINCSAVVSTLLESELFGHEKGSFTGAHQQKMGKLELVGDGTLFLDEIGDMPLELQAKLLRVLQEKEFERVGGVQTVPFHARVVAATHQDLQLMAVENTFREDLLFRLAVARIPIPSLSERRGDITLLVEHLLCRLSDEVGRDVRGIEEEAVKKLQLHDWPGNVRELENALRRAVAVSRQGVITLDDIELSLSPEAGEALSMDQIVPLHQAEKGYIEKALMAHHWNITHTARALEISPTTLRKKIADYGLR